MIIDVIVLCWIWIRGLGVSPSLNRRPEPSASLDLTFLLIRFDDFNFKHRFPIFWIFHDFLKFFRIICKISKIGVGRHR